MRLLEIVTTSFSWLCCCTGTHPFKVSDAPSLYSNTCKRVYLAAFEYTPLICQRGSDVIGHKEKNSLKVWIKGPRWSLTSVCSAEAALRSSAMREPFADTVPMLVPYLCSCIRRIASVIFPRPEEEQVQEETVPSFGVFCSSFQSEFEIHPKL